MYVRGWYARNVDQTSNYLRTTATDLTPPKPKRDFLKRRFKFIGAMLSKQLTNEVKLAESTPSLKNFTRI